MLAANNRQNVSQNTKSDGKLTGHRFRSSHNMTIGSDHKAYASCYMNHRANSNILCVCLLPKVSEWKLCPRIGKRPGPRFRDVISCETNQFLWRKAEISLKGNLRKSILLPLLFSSSFVLFLHFKTGKATRAPISKSLVLTIHRTFCNGLMLMCKSAGFFTFASTRKQLSYGQTIWDVGITLTVVQYFYHCFPFLYSWLENWGICLPVEPEGKSIFPLFLSNYSPVMNGRITVGNRTATSNRENGWSPFFADSDLILKRG